MTLIPTQYFKSTRNLTKALNNYDGTQHTEKFKYRIYTRIPLIFQITALKGEKIQISSLHVILLQRMTHTHTQKIEKKKNAQFFSFSNTNCSPSKYVLHHSSYFIWFANHPNIISNQFDSATRTFFFFCDSIVYMYPTKLTNVPIRSV